ncbi:MAG: alpha-E domain-containing protein [Comamonadaceae bacterium]|nr:alpha-E domain-containing protein [Comamonadaceae bacterium]
MARYMERAENTARMLDVNYQTSLLPQSADMAEQGWRGLLSISELTWSFQQKYSERHAAQRHGLHGARRRATRRASCACLRAARENARAVRGALTTEVWETQNQTWLEFNRLLRGRRASSATRARCSSGSSSARTCRAASPSGTMLQDEALHFLRIGTFLERADNTARLLDVKFHALAVASTSAPAAVKETQEVDFYHWSAILRSVSGFEIYRKVYRNVIRPERVAELLILRPDMPRSLAACMNEVVAQPGTGGQPAERRDAAPRRPAAVPTCSYGRIDEILATGLHAYLTQFLDRVNDLGAGIGRDFLVPVAA